MSPTPSLSPSQQLSNQLALPLNQAVRGSHGGDFALMLSLLMEAHQVQHGPAVSASQALGAHNAAAVSGDGGYGGDSRTEPQFRLELSLNAALAQPTSAQFYLLNSLHAEREYQRLAQMTLPEEPNTSAIDQDTPRRRAADAVLDEIEYARSNPGAVQGG